MTRPFFVSFDLSHITLFMIYYTWYDLVRKEIRL